VCAPGEGTGVVSKSADEWIATVEIAEGKRARRCSCLVIKKTSDRDEIFVTYCGQTAKLERRV